MTCVEKKYFSCFELINTSVLVNSGFLLERDADVHKPIQFARAYSAIRIKIPSLKYQSRLLFRSDQTANRDFFYVRKQKRRTLTGAEFRYRSASGAPL
jgi:hypothetical protein